MKSSWCPMFSLHSWKHPLVLSLGKLKSEVQGSYHHRNLQIMTIEKNFQIINLFCQWLCWKHILTMIRVTLESPECHWGWAFLNVPSDTTTHPAAHLHAKGTSQEADHTPHSTELSRYKRKMALTKTIYIKLYYRHIFHSIIQTECSTVDGHFILRAPFNSD